MNEEKIKKKKDAYQAVCVFRLREKWTSECRRWIGAGRFSMECGDEPLGCAGKEATEAAEGGGSECETTGGGASDELFGDTMEEAILNVDAVDCGSRLAVLKARSKIV